jgi:hypothetical protein
MRLDAGVRRQSTRVTIINGPQPGLAQASDGPCRAVERAPHSWKAAHPWPGPRTPFRLRHPAGVARIGNIKPTSGRLLYSTGWGLPARGAGCGVPPVLAGRAGRPAVSRVPGYE